ncbi:glycoside hydrolase family 39 [Fusarium mexicanum]|uniref:Glycoside hydrolase family 39 n=1 Tax=Fusarium mexicanum TaxID=751941 RepID=A0A8H5MIP5_9HYPO|nr:glycoside hydrolase family 39 [Fusarium mexicanum]
MRPLFLAIFAFALGSNADDSSTAYVDLADRVGPSSHNASAFIYGMPLNKTKNQIPSHFYSDIGIKYGRAGGAQLDKPCRGWAFGPDEYKCRFEATMINYKQTRKFGAQFIILPHDIWGIDYRDSVPSYQFPGDGGNWTSYDNFLNQLVRDLKSRNALDGLIWDIWNEPDIGGFWGRSIQQWVDLYIRTHKRLRSDSALNKVLISGPTIAASPDVANAWWSTWGPQVAGNSTYPDQYAWHYEMGGDSSDPDISNALFENLLEAYQLPFRPVNINEYAVLSEEIPSGYSWWISRLERYNYAGLLGLWNPPLYDNFANLLTKSPGDPKDPGNTNYVGAAGFPLYKYYAKKMVGQRAKTVGSTDRKWDCFATIGPRGDQVRILAGTRVVTGNYTLHIKGLDTVGYKGRGKLNAKFYAFYGSDDIFQPFGDPPYLGTQSVPIVNGEAQLNVNVTDPHTGWRIEFKRY